MNPHSVLKVGFFSLLLIGASVSSPLNQSIASAATAKEIDVSVDASLDRFKKEIPSAADLLHQAKGALIFPAVYKAGIGIGGEYGEGALRMGGKTVDYYSTIAASFGFQLGAQKKTIIILFMEEAALRQFRESSGWKAGVDASIAIVTVGAGGALDTAQIKKPILGFILDQKGLMYNLTLEGVKISKIER